MEPDTGAAGPEQRPQVRAGRQDAEADTGEVKQGRREHEPGDKACGVSQVRNFLTVGMAVKNIEDAPLKFNTLILRTAFGTTNELTWDILMHYARQGLIECYKVLGSMQFLGNPVGLLGNVSDGIFDFFYEPIKGVSQVWSCAPPIDVSARGGYRL